MKSIVGPLCAALVLVAACILAGCDQEGATTQAPAGKAQTTCPVMGGQIDKTIFADYECKRVYFCCPACVEKFNKEPQKYVKKLEDEGVTLATTPRKGG
ncbi:MAG TPA: hypothetical protein VNE39_25500 [Planctomycetota bacterium]|nr:hypothetical protein [Planctomycetota bacterium]